MSRPRAASASRFRRRPYSCRRSTSLTLDIPLSVRTDTAPFRSNRPAPGRRRSRPRHPHIRQTKFGKSRLMPLHATAVAVLSDYAARRDAHLGTPRSPYFFAAEQAADCGINTQRVLGQLSRRVGLRLEGQVRWSMNTRSGPSFRLRTLIKWHRIWRRLLNVSCRFSRLSSAMRMSRHPLVAPRPASSQRRDLRSLRTNGSRLTVGRLIHSAWSWGQVRKRFLAPAALHLGAKTRATWILYWPV